MTLRHHALTAILVGTILVGSVSCGSPAGPTPVVVNISGSWTGTWTFLTACVTVTDTVSVTFTQNGTSASGPWSSASGPGGQLNLMIGAGLSGSASINQTLLSGQNCSASTTVTGTATATRVQVTLGALQASGLCQWATNQEFVFAR